MVGFAIVLPTHPLAYTFVKWWANKKTFAHPTRLLLLSNPAQPTLKPVNVTAIVDTGAVTLCIPEHIAVQLKLEETEQREVTTADTKSHLVPYMGPLKINYLGRTCYTGAIVLGNTVLMGAIPLEDMDLVISPRENTVTVNPLSPNIPSVIVKSLSSS